MSTVTDVPVDMIDIPEGRFRRVAETLKSRDGKRELDELAESIKQLGLLNPVTVDWTGGRYRLIAGEHRFYAVRVLLKRPTITVTLRDEMSDYDRRMAELDENIRRRQMSPAERVAAVAELHRIKSETDPTWTQQQTAAMIGSRRQADVSQAVGLDKLVKMFPDQLAKAKSVNQLQSWGQALAAKALRINKVTQDAKTNPRLATVEERIWLGDSVERVKELPDSFCRLVLTDPPFGVDYDDKVSGTIGSLSDYSDTEEDYERLLSMAPDIYRILKPDGFLIWFFGISWYQRCKEVFSKAGFTVDEIPVVWDRSAGKSWTRRPDKYFSRAYDVALMCIKGDPQIIKRNLPNVIHATPVTTSEREAVVERPIDLYKPFIDRLTVPGEKVVDLFCGAGGVPAACAELRREFFAIEKDPGRRAIAINKVLAHLPK